MTGIGPDKTQTLEVLGTKNLLEVLRDKLEAEGVGVGSTKTDLPKPVIIEPVKEKSNYDIAIPITKPVLTHNITKLSSLRVADLEPIYEQEELDEIVRVTLKMEFATTETEIHEEPITADIPITETLLSAITNKTIEKAKLANVFAELYPVVKEYVVTRCFGKEIGLEDDAIRSHLARLELQEGIAKYLARKIAELMVEKRVIEFENAEFKLSDTKPFSWRRNLPPLVAKKTVFNFVATYNDFEREFAVFLDEAPDVKRFASLGTTEQGESGTQFRVDYLKPSGAIGFYHPDWVVIQNKEKEEISWIIETKGRVWEDTEAKDEAIKEWCARVSEKIGKTWRYARVNQTDFNTRTSKRLVELIDKKDQLLEI